MIDSREVLNDCPCIYKVILDEIDQYQIITEQEALREHKRPSVVA